MKILKRITSIALLLIALMVSGCKKDIDKPKDPTPNTSAEAKLDLGSKVAAKFFGVVKDESGNAISGVAIKAGNKTATTDANGVFIIDQASVDEKLAFVTAKKSGYFLGSRSVIPSTTATNNIRITMLALDIVGSVNSGEEKTITLGSGAAIDFKGKYVDNNGNAYSGAVSVAFKHLPALANETADQMPGMLYAQNAAEEAGVLETYGMIAVELFSATGQELQIDDASSATIRMPLESAQLTNAPNTIPLWHFDEVAGYWIEEGEATLVNGEYVGTVNHFSFWNCDDFIDDAQLNGSVLDQSGNPLSNVIVTIITPNSSTSGLTASDGSFFTYVPANVSVTLEVEDDCGNAVTSFNAGPYTTNSINSETLTATIPTVQVTGMFYDCNNNLITNGYVVLTSGSSTYFQSVTNGLVDIPILVCNMPTSINVKAYDYTAIQESNSITVPVVLPVTNLGNLISCNSISEYITYSIDGGAATTIFPPLSCSAQFDSLTNIVSGFYVYYNGGNSYFQLSSNVIIAGSHPYGGLNGMTIYSSDIEINQGTAPAISFDSNSFGAVGSYVDVNFNGSYFDNNNVSHTLTGTVHALRDN